jgi:hypothetical protein
MKYPNSIPLWRASGELLAGNAPYRIVLSSVGTKWTDVVVEQRHVPSSERSDVMYKRHVIAINLGHSITWECKKEGRFQSVFMPRGAISFFPSHQPFSGRLKVDRDVFANLLFLALNPVFVSSVPEGLEFDADRIELIEQRCGTDSTLHHIAMALLAGVQTGVALDRMYGEALSTALRRPPPTRIWRGSARAENTLWRVVARKAGARGGIYSGSTGCRLNCFRDCSGGWHES